MAVPPPLAVAAPSGAGHTHAPPEKARRSERLGGWRAYGMGRGAARSSLGLGPRLLPPGEKRCTVGGWERTIHGSPGCPGIGNSPRSTWIMMGHVTGRRVFGTALVASLTM